MLRFIASMIVGVVITFGLFVIMAELINSGDKSAQETLENIVVEINTTPPESKTQQRNRVPPPPPPPPQQPPKQPPPEAEPQVSDDGFSFNMPSVNVGNTGAGLSGPGALARDGDATPIFRQEPRFPTKAARDGIEGWVQLKFDINELGNVENVTVIDASPKRIFDREARKALRKWRYNPKVVDGKAIKQIGLTVQLDFSLGGDQ